MKQKLLKALKQGYKQLGLGEEAFERVAAFGETFITSDEQIASFVTAAEPMLKAEQSAADKVRTELNAKIKTIEGERDELKAKLAGNNNPPVEPPKPTDPPTPPADDVPAWAQQLLEQNKQLAEQNKTFADKLTAFESVQSQKSAVAALDAFKGSWDYAKGYPEECADAYERTMEIYEAIGKKWTSEELTTNFKDKFNKLVAKKGVDTSKPFENNGGNDDPDLDMKEVMEMYRKSGRVAEKSE